MNQSFNYSEGEKSVQKSAGVEMLADRLKGMVKSFIPNHGIDFIQNQSFFFISSVDEKGMLWTSIIRGKEWEYIRFLSHENIEINLSKTHWNKNDILFKNLKFNGSVGLLFIDLMDRKRFRINGSAEIKDDKIDIQVSQAFPNCPKYIQARDFNESENTQAIASPIQLDLEGIRKVIEKADTFIMGTQGKNAEVDTSHRGGMPGFVEFTGDKTIKIPDYSGNNMFTSLGNIQENPNTSLLFIDFEQGGILQLSGKAHLALDENDPQKAVERFWYFEIEKNIYTQNNVDLEWSKPDFSPFNPELR